MTITLKGWRYMKKSKLYNVLFWIVGLGFAELWRYLLKDVAIPEFFKWLTGILIIIFVAFIFSKVTSLINKTKESI